MNKVHYAVCLNHPSGRTGIVISDTDSKYVSDMANLIGYVGCPSFQEAVKRSGMMERNETNAWGVINET